MKTNLLICFLFVCLFDFSCYAQNNKVNVKDCSIVMDNEKIILGMKIDPLNSIKQYFTYKEVLHKDYGQLIWKSSTKFIPDNKYDILSYTNNDIEIQAYRGNRKINLIKLKTDKYHVCKYWIGKIIDTESLINKKYDKYDNNIYTIPVFDSNVEIGLLQINVINNKISELVLTSLLE